MAHSQYDIDRPPWQTGMADMFSDVKKPLTICLCGSMAFIDEMEAMAEELSVRGHQVTLPLREEDGVDWSTLSQSEAIARKAFFLNAHFEKIRAADLVVIANYDKNGISGYVGANTLMEAACAHALGKPVWFVCPIGVQGCQLEALAISAGTLGDSGIP